MSTLMLPGKNTEVHTATWQDGSNTILTPQKVHFAATWQVGSRSTLLSPGRREAGQHCCHLAGRQGHKLPHGRKAADRRCHPIARQEVNTAATSEEASSRSTLLPPGKKAAGHNNLLIQPWPSSCWPAHRMGIYSNPLINGLIQHTFKIHLVLVIFPVIP